MKKGWYGFNKVLLGFSMTGGIILVIAATYFSGKLFEFNSDLGFVPVIIFIGGILIVLGYHSLWGLLVETAGNVISLYDQNKYGARMAQQSASVGMVSVPTQPVGAYPVNMQPVPAAVPSAPIMQPAQVPAASESAAFVSPAEGNWFCTVCGYQDKDKAYFCPKCGNKIM